jgi:bifunctional non-homologous end joining protein LigD
MSLKEYQQKRNFSKTAEPRGTPLKGGAKKRFVIQKHAASHLHYDFRLEIDGTLKSWAVPKGVPFKKGEKRLAVEVEDHPVSYIDFEGTIPKGQYGGGTVMVWDHGTFEPLTPVEGLEAGKLHFALAGKKLRGEWYLVRLRDGKQWLLIKGKEDFPLVSKKQDDTSARSGKSMVQLGQGSSVWQSNKGTVASKSRMAKTSSASLPKFVSPMLARPSKSIPAGAWSFELKFDGYRALILKNGKQVQILSRNEKDLGIKFPEIVEAAEGLKTTRAIIDGEIVALDEKGRSSFQLLQAYALGEKRPPLLYYAFDLLESEGEDTKGQPIEERKKALEKLIPKRGPLHFSATLGNDADRLLTEVRRLGLEGLIGKRIGSLYEPGQRTGSWIKVKVTREQEFVIGGYTDPEGTRPHFGSLLVGVYDKNGLKFTGKVGTGFNDKLLRLLKGKMDALAQKDCPFENLPEKRLGRYGQGVTRAEMRRCHWVKPQLVAQVKFMEWTRDEKLRHPVFLGLREDKSATEVGREET